MKRKEALKIIDEICGQFVDDWMHIHLRNKILKKNKVELKVKFFCNQIFH